ncbi:hypothetical protein K501DRAFT_287155 [Backusella circina FSU 941]|nr:hypothetical protein K501DRAFT_287155 [Backusella circina FSU 941]
MLKISRNRISEGTCGLEEADYYFKDWNDLSDELFYSSQVNMSPSTSAISSSWSFVSSPPAASDSVSTVDESKSQQYCIYNQQKSNCCTTIAEEEQEEDEFEIIKHNDNRKKSIPSNKASQFVIILNEASIERYSSLFDSIQDCGHVDGSTVKAIWNKSCLPKEILYQIWRDCEPVDGLLDRDAFIVGMGKIDTILEQYKSYNLLL